MSEEEHKGPWILMKTGGGLINPRYWSESEARWTEDISKANVYEDGGDSATIYYFDGAGILLVASRFLRSNKC